MNASTEPQHFDLALVPWSQLRAADLLFRIPDAAWFDSAAHDEFLTDIGTPRLVVRSVALAGCNPDDPHAPRRPYAVVTDVTTHSINALRMNQWRPFRILDITETDNPDTEGH